MADEENEYSQFYYDIEAAYNALLAIESLDIAMYMGKRAEGRIRRNCLFIIDRAIQYIADSYEVEDED